MEASNLVKNVYLMMLFLQTSFCHLNRCLTNYLKTFELRKQKTIDEEFLFPNEKKTNSCLKYLSSKKWIAENIPVAASCLVILYQELLATWFKIQRYDSLAFSTREDVSITYCERIRRGSIPSVMKDGFVKSDENTETVNVVANILFELTNSQSLLCDCIQDKRGC